MVKRTMLLIVVAISVSLVVLTKLMADTSVKISTISASATVSGTYDFSASLFKIVDNSAATSLNFGTVTSGASAWNNLTAEYVKISVSDNAVAWRLRTYSNNYTSQPSTSVWGYQYGGLKGAISGAKVPMGWFASKTIISGGPAKGNPINGSTNGWTFLKDFRDVDDPGPVGDQSFSAADAAGYCNVAFGGASYTRIVKPAVSGGTEELTNVNDPFYLYFEGNFQGAAATTYSGNIIIELLNL